MKKRKCEIDVVAYTILVHGFGCVSKIKHLEQFCLLVFPPKVHRKYALA